MNLISFEKCINELWERRDTHMVRVMGDEYSIKPKTKRGFRIYASQLLDFHITYHDESWAFGLNDGQLWFYFPRNYKGLQHKGHVEKVDGSGRIPILHVDGVEYKTWTGYLALFGLPNTPRNQYLVKEWVYRQASKVKSTTAQAGKLAGLDINRYEFLESYSALNHFHKATPVFVFKGLPPIYGFNKLVEVFPAITPDEIQELFDNGGMELNAPARKYIRDYRKTGLVKKQPSKPFSGTEFIRDGNMYFVGETGYSRPEHMVKWGINGEKPTEREAKEIWKFLRESKLKNGGKIIYRG